MKVELSKNNPSVPKSLSDKAIKQRLEKIYNVTGWFPELELDVKEGIVIFSGNIDDLQHRVWAFDIAKKTDGVIASIDKLNNSDVGTTVLNPAKNEVTELYNKTSKQIPYIISGIVILMLFIMISWVVRILTKKSLSRKYNNKLIIKTITGIIGILVIIIGFYLALNASGLSTLAISLLGGTGMLGIGVGLALKSSFENYTSSLMISLNELIKLGEIVNIDGHEGVVQSVTTRGTTLMDYSGNNIIIPNTQVFNSVIKNLTRNPNMRTNFSVGIGYDDSINEARKIIHDVLKSMNEHVLQDPEPIIAVDSLGASTVNLKVYFWINTMKSSIIKLKSSVIQNVKEALVDADISMPDDAREVVFASPLKLQQMDDQKEMIAPEPEKPVSVVSKETHHHEDLGSEIEDLKEQVLKMPTLDNGENLI